MREIVWALDNKQSNFTDLSSKIKTYATDFCEDCHLELKFESSSKKVDNLVIGSGIKRNTYLIVKEVLNNIAKHADAKKVLLQVHSTNKKLTIKIKDNGRGFSTQNSTSGNGLQNIKDRVRSIDGDLEINSGLNQGTEITVFIPL